jgi:hypothetical protein
MMKKRVLFLCSGNSARSQMAEGLVNHFLDDRWEAYSAGTAPTGHVHIGVPDPAAAIGTEAERLEIFRRVRDGFRQKVLSYLEEVGDSAVKEGGFYVTATGNL